MAGTHNEYHENQLEEQTRRRIDNLILQYEERILELEQDISPSELPSGSPDAAFQFPFPGCVFKSLKYRHITFFVFDEIHWDDLDFTSFLFHLRVQYLFRTDTSYPSIPLLIKDIQVVDLKLIDDKLHAYRAKSIFDNFIHKPPLMTRIALEGQSMAAQVIAATLLKFNVNMGKVNYLLRKKGFDYFDKKKLKDLYKRINEKLEDSPIDFCTRNTLNPDTRGFKSIVM